jgi:hypothetical protein
MINTPNYRDTMDIVVSIALIAMDNDAVRAQIQDELELSDEELSEIYKILVES